ncbi:MAG: T9SS type A sorting domain-containing protein [Bacteroidetes bacterium]|nr:T9SS type A sorting domain-containing protein [Bacteroidota bacterium]
MKKIFTAFILLGLGFAAKAQTFTVYPKVGSISGDHEEYELVVHSMIHNQTGDSNFTWKRVTNNLETNWESGVCDNITCWGTEKSRSEFLLPQGDSGLLDVHFYLHNTYGNGMVKIAIWSGSDSASADTVTYNAGTWAMSVNKPSLVKDVKVYPNPSHGTLNIDFPSTGTVKIEIFDVLGKKMSQPEYQGEHTRIDVGGLPNGLYILRITENGKLYSRTFRLAN